MKGSCELYAIINSCHSMNYWEKIALHVQHLQVLATEMYKVSNELSTPIMKGIFLINKNPCSLRRISQISRRLLKTVYHGTESISNFFKQAIKKWKTENCPCRLCKVYVQNVDFL